MSEQYKVQCDCGSVEVLMEDTPRVHAYCHCEDCRTLLDVPYHSIVAWESDNVRIISGEEHAVAYKYPTLDMTRVFCKHCGETVYNTNALGWRLISQLLIRKCNNGDLPDEFRSNGHFYYDRRIVDIDDQLPKSWHAQMCEAQRLTFRKYGLFSRRSPRLAIASLSHGHYERQKANVTFRHVRNGGQHDIS